MAENCSAAQKAYETIRDEIVLQKLTPGSIIVESDYGEKLGMSRTPVREALKRLSNEGFVSIIPRKGAIVSSYSLKDMLMCHEIARDIDGALCANLARAVRSGELSADALSPLLGLCGEMEKRLAEGDIRGWTECDSRFHRMLIGLCQNPYIVMCASQIRMHLTRVLWFVTPAHIDKSRSNAEHRETVEAIAAGCENAARKAAMSQSERISQELRGLFAGMGGL